MVKQIWHRGCAPSGSPTPCGRAYGKAGDEAVGVEESGEGGHGGANG